MYYVLLFGDIHTYIYIWRIYIYDGYRLSSININDKTDLQIIVANASVQTLSSAGVGTKLDPCRTLRVCMGFVVSYCI